MSTKKMILIISGLVVIGLVIGLTLDTNTESSDNETGEVNLELVCPEDFSEGEIITLKVSDSGEGLENVSVYLDGERYGDTNRHGNLVLQAPSPSFETEFRYNGEFLEADKNEC